MYLEKKALKLNALLNWGSKKFSRLSNRIQKFKDDWVHPYNMYRHKYKNNAIQAGYKTSLDWAQRHPLGTASIVGTGLILSKLLGNSKDDK